MSKLIKTPNLKNTTSETLSKYHQIKSHYPRTVERIDFALDVLSTSLSTYDKKIYAFESIVNDIYEQINILNKNIENLSLTLENPKQQPGIDFSIYG